MAHSLPVRSCLCQYMLVCSCRSMAKRWISALSWVAVTAVVLGLILGICYGQLSSHSLVLQSRAQCRFQNSSTPRCTAVSCSSSSAVTTLSSSSLTAVTHTDTLHAQNTVVCSVLDLASCLTPALSLQWLLTHTIAHPAARVQVMIRPMKYISCSTVYGKVVWTAL